MCLRASFITLRSIVIVKLLRIQRLTNAFGLLLSVKAVQYSSAHRSPVISELILPLFLFPLRLLQPPDVQYYNYTTRSS